MRHPMNAYPVRPASGNEPMGFFESVGRQVEQFRQTAKEAADDNADFQCQSCNARFNATDDQCPECGSREIVSTKAGE